MSRPDLTPVESAATAWLARRDRGFTPDEQAEFDRWCAADPAHGRAVAECGAVWSVFDQPRHSSRAELLHHELRALERRDRRRWAGGAVAVTLVAACLVLLFQFRPPDSVPAGAPAAVTARVDSPVRQTLPDGSVVELRPGAAIAVAFEPALRRVLLNQSEAHFSVVKDPDRPFVVDAGGVQVRAIGTAFSVQRNAAQVEVIVTEGSVAVASASATVDGLPATSAMPDAISSGTLVAAGHRFVVPLATAVSSVVESLSVPELTERLAWRLPRLDFSDTSVAEAVGLFNQHSGKSSHRLVVGDDAVASHRLTGLFRSDNVEGFVRALESSFGVHAERRPGEIILRSN